MIFFFSFSLAHGHISIILLWLFLFSEFIHPTRTRLAFVAHTDTIPYHDTRCFCVTLLYTGDVTPPARKKPRFAKEDETRLTAYCKAVII